MIYLVDGHNLIPKIPGLSLQAADDEMQLIEVLQTFSRLKRKKVEVYFDRAASGQAGVRKFGMITAHFIHQTSSADLAIKQRLERSGKENRNFCIVSSDRAVQNSARMHHAQFQTSEAFASELLRTISQVGKSSDNVERKISEEETAEWLKIFNQASPGKSK
ncbi:MAG: NYN domain-containing protein [Anaerolineaceae bacterium]